MDDKGDVHEVEMADIELVKSVHDITNHEDNAPQPDPVPIVRTEAEVLEVVSNYFMQAIQTWYAADTGKNLDMRITTSVSTHNSDFTLTYSVRLGYGDIIKCSSLHKAMGIAVTRCLVDKANQPLEISYRTGVDE